MSAPAVAEKPWGAFGWVALCYALGLVTAWGVVRLLPPMHPLATVAVADVVATLVVFGFSRAKDNSSFYDPYWSVAPLVIALYLMLGPGHVLGITVRQVVVVSLVSLWSWRLTLNWARGWMGLTHEDWRYVDMRAQTGQGYWWASLFGLHLFPTVLVYLGMLPTWAALAVSGRSFGVVDLLAAAVTLGAIVVETVADEQLRWFRRSAKKDGTICDVGLWRYSRHPNYFGEVSFWVGLWLFGVAAGASAWTAVGPISMIGLFVFASIPLIERRSLKRRPEYAAHMQRVSMLVPLPPRSQG